MKSKSATLFTAAAPLSPRCAVLLVAGVILLSTSHVAALPLRGRKSRLRKRKAELARAMSIEAAAAGSMSERGLSSMLLVLDFDWTVINCNSDTDVVEHFAVDEDELRAMRARLNEAGKSDAWTKGMDAEMDLLHKVFDVDV